MIRRPPRSTRTEHTLSLHDALPISFQGTCRNCERNFVVALQDGSRSCGVIVNLRSNCSSYDRSEEHTSELQSLMRISYAVFCLKKKNHKNNNIKNISRE